MTKKRWRESEGERRVGGKREKRGGEREGEIERGREKEIDMER